MPAVADMHEFFWTQVPPTQITVGGILSAALRSRMSTGLLDNLAADMINEITNFNARRVTEGYQHTSWYIPLVFSHD